MTLLTQHRQKSSCSIKEESGREKDSISKLSSRQGVTKKSMEEILESNETSDIYKRRHIFKDHSKDRDDRPSLNSPSKLS